MASTSATLSKITKKKTRRKLNLETKIKIIEMLEKDSRISEVARLHNLNESTIRTIKSNTNSTIKLAVREAIRVLKNIDKSRLPVHWKSNKKSWMTAALFEDWFSNIFCPENKKSWMTAALFEDWFSNIFCPEVEEYCRVNKIPFKILLLVDNAPSHSETHHLHPKHQGIHSDDSNGY
ncbi:DDE superfamily endonuclease [Popillia japonica]|uniref:DDE superfamily endonuclease n=1 Tax=Popillia japonica TaxID=7064 RepID=A0AAW1LR88_POPJA